MTLEIKNLSFGYKKDTIFLHDISFTAHKGDMIAILGPNGAGKTTLLKCIMGFLKPVSGSILLGDKSIDSYSRRDLWKKIAYVPQNRSTNYSLDVRNMILLGTTGRVGIFRSPGKKEYELVDEISDKLGIKNLLDKKCAELSGGEYQLVLIARALAAKPEVIILDEPESNLDFKNQLTVLDILSSLNKEGITCIFNTHYPDHALQKASHALLIDRSGYIFGESGDVVTSDNIRKSFGVDTLIGEFTENGKTYKSIIPVSISV